MPQNGYWIECIPVTTGETDTGYDTDNGQSAGLLYRAEIASIPEANAMAKTPDKAIQELRDKLSALRHDYCTQGKDLPAHDNPVRPPRNSKLTRGWMSVYVQMCECCKNI